MKKKIQVLMIAGFSSTGLFAQNSPAPFAELFCPIDTNWQGNTLIVPQGTLHYNILLQEGDLAYNIEKNTNAPVKGGFGGLFFDRDIRESVTLNNATFLKNTAGWIYLSLLDNKTAVTGDGGGYVKLRVKQNAGNEWEVVPETSGSTTYNCRAFDLDAMGGTYQNNGIHLGYSALSSAATKGNIFMHDGWAENNAELAPGFSSMGDYTLPAGGPGAGTAIPRYKNMGWIIEVNEQTGMPVKKLYYAGRASIGGLRATSAKTASLPEEATYNKGLLFTTRTQPAVILKYELQDNKMYAYQQEAGSAKGTWLVLNEQDVDGSIFPLSFEELSDIRKVALQKGATMFNNLGSVVKNDNDGSFYIAETGGTAPAGSFTDPNVIYSGKLAHHLSEKITSTGSKDYYGRILRMYSNTEGKTIVEPYLEGGVSADARYTFSNPKSLWNYNFNYAPPGGSASSAQYLIITEEVTDASFRRNPLSVSSPDDLMNEVFFLNTNISTPDISDLRPFAIGPKGAEIHAAFSVEGPSPLFLSLRYPNTSNTAPYNKSLLISINNFEEYFSHPEACNWVVPPHGTDTSTTAINEVEVQGKNSFRVWPNPASRMLYFAELQKEIQLFDINGRLLKHATAIKELDIFDLHPGVYILRNGMGQVKKIIIE